VKIDMINASPQLLDEAESRGSIEDAGPKDRRHDKKYICIFKCGFSLRLAGPASDAETPGPGIVDSITSIIVGSNGSMIATAGATTFVSSWRGAHFGRCTTVFPLRNVAVKSID
jgi:hypothetical protein